MLNKNIKEIRGKKITTIKVSYETKKRLDKLRLYSRETYEQILQRILNILNLSRINPEQAQKTLIMLERQIKRRDFIFEK